MNRFFKGMTYAFKRNLGWKDRIIRAVCAFVVIGLWYFGTVTGVIGIVLAVLALMILGTAVSSRCPITYWSKANTMAETEKIKLESKGIEYEK